MTTTDYGRPKPPPGLTAHLAQLLKPFEAEHIIPRILDAVALDSTPASVGHDAWRSCGITPREAQVLGGMARGLTNGAIGRELYLTEQTIKTHARRLFRKLGVRDRAQAVAVAYVRGLIKQVPR